LAQQPGIVQADDNDETEVWVNEALAAMPDKVKEYQKGKKGLIGLFVGEVKKRSKGKANPQLVTKLLEEKLNA
jgi:aspartyl-tRNA(Asn)/glutamyl-tRNA(Gln) amidotransferase subunit B